MDAMTSSRVQRSAALEAWADQVEVEDLRTVDTDSLRRIASLAQHRDNLEAELVESVREARAARRTWSEIGTMLGVSKQAAQRKYGTRVAGPA